jgi:hypothetical protein
MEKQVFNDCWVSANKVQVFSRIDGWWVKHHEKTIEISYMTPVKAAFINRLACHKMENEALPSFIRYVGYLEYNIDIMAEQYKYLLYMGFNPFDETTPKDTIFVMDKKTIFYEFEQLHKGVGNQVLQEFLSKNGIVVLISKYHEIYVYVV